MGLLLSRYGSRSEFEPMVAIAMPLRTLGAEVRWCAPMDFATEEWDAQDTSGVMPTGGWL